MEIWKTSPLGPAFVEVSNLGRIRAKERLTSGISKGKAITQLRPAKMLSPCVEKNGYLYQSITENSHKTKYLVHRLVASCFCEGFDASITVNHIDGNKLNNNASNLEWVTKSVNSKLQWETGLVNTCGENSISHKLSDSDLGNLRYLLSEGISVIEIAKTFSVSTSLVYAIKNGTRRSGPYGGKAAVPPVDIVNPFAVLEL